MSINVVDKSVGLKADIDTSIDNGKIRYELYFKCDHEQAAIVKGEYPFATYGVVCLGCRGEDLTEDEADDMILSHIEEENYRVEDRLEDLE